MNHQPSPSLIVTTYNWPEALGITLFSALKQSRSPGEIIVADDGSAPAWLVMLVSQHLVDFAIHRKGSALAQFIHVNHGSLLAGGLADS